KSLSGFTPVRPVLTSTTVMLMFGSSYGKRARPEKLTGLLCDGKHATAFGDGDHDVLLGTGCQGRIDPFHRTRIRVHARANQNALVVVIRVPIVTWKFLEVPHELTGLHVESDSRVAVELCWRGERDRIVAAVTFEPCVGIGVGHTPIHDLTDRVVRARQTPRA